MSNYVQQTDFSAKDDLSTGDPEKLIRGSDVDNELDAIATAVATKEDVANKGIAEGYASLDVNTKVPLAQIPEADISIDGAQVATGAVAIARGGTGASTKLAAREALGIYSAFIEFDTNTTTYTCQQCPAGWSINRTAVGTVFVTHNFGHTNYIPAATGITAVADSVYPTVGGQTSTQFWVEVRSSGEGLDPKEDDSFALIVIEN